MPIIHARNGQKVVAVKGTLSIDRTANDAATLSTDLRVSGGNWPSLGDRYGVVKDVAPGARSFNGTSSVAYRAYTDSTINNYTYGVWVRATSAADNQAPMHIGNDSVGYGFLSAGSGYWRAHYQSVTSIGGTSAPIAVGAWQLLVVRRSSGTSQLFLDGVAVGSTTGSAPSAPSSSSYWALGGRYVGSLGLAFTGDIAWSFFTNNVLTNTQILRMAQGGPGGMGISPNQFDPGNFFRTYPLSGAASEIDTDGSNALTVVNAPASSDGPMVLTAAGSAIFAGEIDQAPVSGVGGYSLQQTEVSISASDHQGLITRRLVSGNRSGENLKARLTWLATYLSVYGVTLDAAQDNGPTLAARSYDDVSMATVIEDLSNECASLGDPRLLEIDELLVMRMPQPSAVSAPWDLDEDAPGHLVGDLTVEPSKLGGYANRVVGLYGTPGETVQRTDTFTGNGSTNSFVLTYVPVSFRGLVTYNGSENTLGTGAMWTYNAGTNAITRTAGAPANGSTISIVYTSKLPIRVESTDGSHATNPVDVKIEDTSIVDLPAAQAKNDAELATRLSLLTQVTAKYTTHDDGTKVGQSQEIDYATTRGVNSTFVIIEQRISDVPDGEKLAYNNTLVDGVNFTTWRQKARSSAGSSSAPLSGVGTFVVPAGMNDQRGNVLAQQETEKETEIGFLSPDAVIGGTSQGGIRFGPRVATLTEMGWFILGRPGPHSGRTELLFFDNRDGAGNGAAMSLRYEPTFAGYAVGPPAASIAHTGGLSVGMDSTGKRVTVNGDTVRASNGYRERGRSVPMGEWIDYSGSIVWGASGTQPTNPSWDRAHYMLVGKTAFVELRLNMGGSTTFGTGAYTFSLPLTAGAGSVAVGQALLFDNGTNFRVGTVMTSSTTTVQVFVDQAGGAVGATSPFTFTSGDYITMSFKYPIA